jgi:hypothetical protein
VLGGAFLSGFFAFLSAGLHLLLGLGGGGGGGFGSGVFASRSGGFGASGSVVSGVISSVVVSESGSGDYSAETESKHYFFHEILLMI